MHEDPPQYPVRPGPGRRQPGAAGAPGQTREDQYGVDLPDGDPRTTDPYGANPHRGSGIGRQIGRGLGRATVVTAKLTGRGASSTYHLARKASHADGAGESGLYRLIEIHFFSILGDTAVALALAGTMFFSMPTDGGGTSRQQIALFLLLTMLPFTFIAPLIGPFLDRYRHGRRWAIGSMMAIRVVLCVVLANTLGGASLTQFLATLGVLIASKAYNVSRIAGTPRLLPPQLTLVKANGRMSMAGVVGATLAAPLGVGLGYLGNQWVLYLAAAAFGFATVLSILLPPTVDTRPDEDEPIQRPVPTGSRTSRIVVPPQVITGFRINAGLRALSGFLIIFMAFVMQQSPFPGWEDDTAMLLGLFVGAVGVGNGIGTAVAALISTRAPQFTLALVLLLDAAAAVVCAVSYQFWTTMTIALVAGLCQQLGKLSLDSVIQREVPEEVHTTIFARSETVLQLAFVIGAFIGIIPMTGRVGMILVAALLVGWTVLVLSLRSGRSLPSLMPFMVVRRSRSASRQQPRAHARSQSLAPRSGDGQNEVETPPWALDPEPETAPRQHPSTPAPAPRTRPMSQPPPPRQGDYAPPSYEDEAEGTVDPYDERF